MSIMEMNTRSARVRQPSLILSLINGLLEWNDRRVTRNELSKLSDQALDDIGLTRFDVTRMR
ncbi:DUF1127 domain-containing protein [Thioclava sp. BHET1]|uniref:YjiS-like domain-containing protein n=1 Tax=Thioclava dalianensis TaxID=1185766 RepID=A0A074TD30_9RHOB|nr:DUF1127 domain-containing protein [Thioclava dalianensis]KEP68085.1 hypothetical protein DL1_15105 [Thioclava dalianensis]TMV94764.1 DUF1127 domain-containing protein [Thioclava sp. BHET1]SFM90797.1 Uncharacterized conserved protein YjiS, DUF1127 family [Thioclava dalianensis]